MLTNHKTLDVNTLTIETGLSRFILGWYGTEIKYISGSIT